MLTYAYALALVAAYESMMDALSEPNSSYEVDLPMKKLLEDGSETTWYYIYMPTIEATYYICLLYYVCLL